MWFTSLHVTSPPRPYVPSSFPSFPKWYSHRSCLKQVDGLQHLHRRTNNTTQTPLRSLRNRRTRSITSRLKHLQIIQPSPRVEFRIHSINHPSFLLTTLTNLHNNNSLNLLLRRRARSLWLRRFPSHRNKITSVPNIQNLKGNVRLRTLACLERFQRSEGRRAEGLRTVGTARVDERVDAVGVVVEIFGQVGGG